MGDGLDLDRRLGMELDIGKLGLKLLKLLGELLERIHHPSTQLESSNLPGLGDGRVSAQPKGNLDLAVFQGPANRSEGIWLVD